MKKFSYQKIRDIPIKEVAEKLELSLRLVGPKTWGVWDEDLREMTSLTLFEKINRFERYSRGEKGSTLDLVMHIHNCSLEQAAEFLSNSFPHLS